MADKKKVRSLWVEMFLSQLEGADMVRERDPKHAADLEIAAIGCALNAAKEKAVATFQQTGSMEAALKAARQELRDIARLTPTPELEEASSDA